jgi:DNA-binding transcriptional ArsR family regulator
MINPERTAIPVLPEDAPVSMPELPTSKTISTLEQYRAISDPTRTRILNIVQLTPATAKQIADRLGASPGAIGHHLHVLEDAGLVQVSARRLVRGIVASYYTRTARIFMFQLPEELIGAETVNVDIVSKALEELKESQQEEPEGVIVEGFPHARLTAERAEHYAKRIQEVIDDLLHEPADGTGEVYGFLVSFFKSPAYLQNRPDSKSGNT